MDHPSHPLLLFCSISKYNLLAQNVNLVSSNTAVKGKGRKKSQTSSVKLCIYFHTCKYKYSIISAICGLPSATVVFKDFYYEFSFLISLTIKATPIRTPTALYMNFRLPASTCSYSAMNPSLVSVQVDVS